MGDLVTVHATCVAMGGRGVLLRGAPGAGKSDLALRLIASRATLVSDDQVIISRQADRLIASAPVNLQGLLEVRGVGICSYPFMRECQLAVIVDLVCGATPERLPDAKAHIQTILGLDVSAMVLDPFHASGVAKVQAKLALLQKE